LIDDTLSAGGRAMDDLLRRARVRRIPLRVVAEVADPEVAFLNVNTPADLAQAKAILGRGS
jgi:molybdopterin-guanine dinucleotide biosynthesis protein A